MKKLFLLAMVLGAFMATDAGAVGQCWCFGGEDGVTYWYLYDYDGYPLEEGDYVYAAWVGPDGSIDPPAISGDIGGVTGDDQLIKEHIIHDLAGFNFSITVWAPGEGFPEAGMVIYTRIFDDSKANLGEEDHYADATNTHFLYGVGEEYFAMFPGDPGEGYTDTPLGGVPVGLMSFEAVGSDGQVALKWKTASEVDNFGFHIERSPDAETFHRITHEVIPGAGDSETENTYAYVDRGLVNGTTYYYNLISVDRDGVEEVVNASPVAATPTAQVPNAFRLDQNYPNPFNPVTNITYAIPRDSYVTLKVYNVLGHEVATLVDEHQQASFYTVRWDAEGLASGVYFCAIVAGDFRAVKKMVLLK